MLILTRRVGESLMIGDEVTVTVLGVNGKQARIGIDAPKAVPVHREEIYDRVQEEGVRQQRSGVDDARAGSEFQVDVTARGQTGIHETG